MDSLQPKGVDERKHEGKPGFLDGGAVSALLFILFVSVWLALMVWRLV